VQDAVDLFPSGEVFEDPVGDDGGFTVAVERDQLSSERFLGL